MSSLFSREFWRRFASGTQAEFSADVNALPGSQAPLFVVVYYALLAAGALLGGILALAFFAPAYLIASLIGADNPLVVSLIVVIEVAVYLRYRRFFVAAYTKLQRFWYHRSIRIQR